MEVILTLLFGGAALGLGLLQRRRRLQGWRDAALACGLEILEVAGWRRRLTARMGPVDVKIEPCGHKGRSTRIMVSLPGPPDFHAVSIRREPLLRFAQEIEIGDSSFDGTFFLEGPARLVHALLDAETRRHLIDLNSCGRLEISGGALRVEDLSEEQVPYVLRLLLDVGRRLAQPMDVLQRLTDNAHRDPEPGVRLRNLLVLARELPGQPWTVEALRTACSDPSPEIRLRAAQELGAEGRDVLLDLAEGLEDDSCSARAVSHLGGELPFERTQSILYDALRKSRPQTARVCLEALGRRRDVAVGVLARVLEEEKGELAIDAARALGATGEEAAEAPLLLALQREEADLRIAAAVALGRVGSVEAVLPLQEAAERSWLDLEIRRAARQAMAEIQSRLPGASPGQLSLAATEAGQLSLAPDAGQLSLAQEEPPPRARETPGVRPV